MLSRLARTARKVPSPRHFSRRDNGWSKKHGRLPFIGALAAAAGTVAAVKLATSDEDTDDRSDYLRLLKRTLTPTTAVMVSQASVDSSEDVESKENKMKARAQVILKHCGVTDETEIKDIIDKMTEYLEHKRKGSGGVTETEKHLINDAIYGAIPLSPLLYQIINTKEFQRLKDLRQLGGTHYVYPGANHTRFEHSIGVSYVAGKFARSLKEQLEKDKHDKVDCGSRECEKIYKFTEEEVLCAQIAGLCHDLGHGPLSHMFEKVMKEKLELDVHHEKISISMLKRLLTNPRVLGEFVYEKLDAGHVRLIENMIDPPKLEDNKCDNRLFLYEIVANKRTGIDVDKWDYYQRDCHYLGILQDFQWKRTMLLGRILMTPDGYEGKNKLRIAFRDKEMNNLYGMFRTRANIHQKACQHKTIKAVERMYIEAMDLVQDLHIVWAPVTRLRESDPLQASDDGSFKSMKESVELATRKDKPVLDWYMAMTDSIITAIKSARACTPDNERKLAQAKELLRRVEERDLYTCSARKRVSKFCPLVDFLKHDHPAHDACQLCKQELHRDPEVKVIKDMYKDHKKCQKFEVLVHENLPLEEQSIIPKDKIWVEVVKIKHPSEDKDNPVDEVIFYKKSKSPGDLPETLEKNAALKRSSMVMVPQAFIEYELRVYDKRPKVERRESHYQALNTAMENAWSDFIKTE